MVPPPGIVFPAVYVVPMTGIPKVELVLKATITGLLETFSIQLRFIWLMLNDVAVKLAGLAGGLQPAKQKETSFVVVFSAMLVKGKPVFAPAHECEWGVVASVKEVLFDVPG